MPSTESCGVKPGDVFHRLTVIGICGKSRGKENVWECRCECGGTARTKSYRLKSGHTRSCGCYKKDRAVQASLKHGCTVGRKRTPEHRIWQHLLGRCLCKTDSAYENYGGRGIKVCDRWLEFKNFLEDMGTRPSSNHSLDRINNHGDYSPSNCRWATREQQSNNRRSTIVLGYQGSVGSLMEWARMLGVKGYTLRERYKKGWSMEEVLFGKAGK